MKHDVQHVDRMFPDVRIQTWRLLKAAELCQMSDGPSTFHWASDVSLRLDQVSDASFVAL